MEWKCYERICQNRENFSTQFVWKQFFVVARRETFCLVFVDLEKALKHKRVSIRSSCSMHQLINRKRVEFFIAKPFCMFQSSGRAAEQFFTGCLHKNSFRWTKFHFAILIEVLEFLINFFRYLTKIESNQMKNNKKVIREINYNLRSPQKHPFKFSVGQLKLLRPCSSLITSVCLFDFSN